MGRARVSHVVWDGSDPADPVPCGDGSDPAVPFSRGCLWPRCPASPGAAVMCLSRSPEGWLSLLSPSLGTALISLSLSSGMGPTRLSPSLGIPLSCLAPRAGSNPAVPLSGLVALTPLSPIPGDGSDLVIPVL